MSTPAYRSLINSFCSLTRLSNPHSLYEHTAVEFNGIDFTLLHQDTPSGGRILLHGDLGNLPAGDLATAAAAQRLLEMNFHLFDGHAGPVFTLNPQSRRVTLGVNLPLPGLHAERLVELLAELADLARAWRRDCFLEAHPERPPSERPMAGLTRSALHSS